MYDTSQERLFLNMKKFVVAFPSTKSVMYGGFSSRSTRRWCIANNIYIDVYTDVIPGGVCCSAQTDDLVMGHSM